MVNLKDKFTMRSKRDCTSSSSLSSRRLKDRLASGGFLVLTIIPLVLLVSIVLALVIRAWPIVQIKPINELLFGRIWKPMQGQFGFLPFIVGTFWVTITSLVIAVPPCLLTAIYLAEYTRPRTSAFFKPWLDLLAGIPSVVYGVWGLVAIVPAVEWMKPAVAKWLGFIPLFSSTNPTGYSILAGSLVLAVMIAPFMISVAYEVMRAIPIGAREASLALGATRWQTIRHSVLPVARPGIIAGVVLGASRALGETMAVLMVVGNVATIPKSIFDPAYPLPALIANNYGEMLSIPLYDAALLGAALVLLVIVLTFNIASNLVLDHIIGRIKT